MKIQGIKTPEDLFKVLSHQFEPSKENQKPLRYVVYLRKSTDDNENQKNSLEDQREECLKMIAREGLILVNTEKDILEEKKSAKESDKRPVFRQMLNMVQEGKYDGIIAWHPNRLARNMKDAGEIIDLLDKGVIKSLKFPTFQFQNNSMGKMTLGLTFVLSKQYSDNLSDSVNRGNKYRLEEGKYIGKSKHGYYKDPDGKLRPDGRNFQLIKEAFQLRLNGMPYNKIADFLNENNYSRTNSQNGKTYSQGIDKQRVQKFLKDPIYAGVVVYGSKVINLTELYKFETIISAPDFMKINSLDSTGKLNKLAKSYRSKEDIKANLLIGTVSCSECGETKSAGITQKANKDGSKKNYFYYRCHTDGCPLENKSTRAKVVIDFVKDYLAKDPFSSKEAFNHCRKELQRVSKSQVQELNNKLTGAKRRKDALLENIGIVESNIARENNNKIRAIQIKDLEHNKKRLINIEQEIMDTEQKVDDAKVIPLEYSKFLELLENIKHIIAKTDNMQVLDYYIQKIFSNFSVNQKTLKNIH